MTICFPKDIHAEPGMCAVRVLVPETTEEAGMLTRTPNKAWPLYRVVIWQQERAWFGYWHGEVLLTATAYLQLRGIHPSHWVELTRAKLS